MVRYIGIIFNGLAIGALVDAARGGTTCDPGFLWFVTALLVMSALCELFAPADKTQRRGAA
jgi:hypothetical protein